MRGTAQAAGSPLDGGNGTLTRIRLDRFTAFRRLDLELTPGVNSARPAGTGAIWMKKPESLCEGIRSRF